MLNDAELMKQRRIQTLKNSILAQLGVSDADQEANSEPLPGEEEMKATFNALRSASASLDREKERRCHSDDFYAKPVSSFVGVVSEGEVPSQTQAMSMDAVKYIFLWAMFVDNITGKAICKWSSAACVHICG